MTNASIRSLSTFALLLGALFVASAGCRTQARTAQYGPAPVCADGPPICSFDRRAVTQCQRGQWVMLQACPGAQGCIAAPNGMVQACDSRAAAPQPAPAPAGGNGVGIACAAEGGYECTPDRRGLTICRGGRTVLASTCRGARGCVATNAVDCDHSIANLGDACESTKEIACSTDSKTLLRCNGASYAFGEACRNACLSTGGRVLCQ